MQEVAALWRCGAGAIDERFVLVQRPSLGVTETAVVDDSTALQQQLQAAQVMTLSARLKHVTAVYFNDYVVLAQSCN
jgi:hypothetical protein